MRPEEEIEAMLKTALRHLDDQESTVYRDCGEQYLDGFRTALEWAMEQNDDPFEV